MYIQVEETPNHNALKFVTTQYISEKEPFFYNQPSDLNKKFSPLAKELFDIDGIKAVFFGKDFITLTKNDDMDWSLIKPSILSTISDYLSSNKDIFTEDNINNASTQQEASNISNEDLSEIEKQIIELINTRIRPSVAMDGGDIIYKKFENGILYLELKGACNGCPSASVTLQQGIKSMMQHFIPEVIDVQSI